jgi:hypothetical protein
VQVNRLIAAEPREGAPSMKSSGVLLSGVSAGSGRVLMVKEAT